MCQLHKTPLEDQTISFLLSLGQGVYVFKESPKSIQDVIGNVYWPGKYCSNRDKWEYLGGYVTTPRSIYGCGNCGARLFVHRVPFTLQKNLKTTNNRQNTLLLCWKKISLLPDEQLFIFVTSQSTKFRKEQMCLDNKTQEIMGDA